MRNGSQRRHRPTHLSQGAFAIVEGVLDHGAAPGNTVLEGSVQRPDAVLDLLQVALQVLDVDRPCVLEVEAEQCQHVGDGHAVGHQDHALPVGLEVAAPAGIEDRVRNGRDREPEGAGWIDVLANLPHLGAEHPLHLVDCGCLACRV